MARGGKWDDECCAAHGGEIAGWGKLSERLNSLADYEQLFEREVTNVRRAVAIGGAAIGGAVILGPLALGAAPAIGGAVGTTVFGLSGAAATAKGLAALGLGSLAAGGYGIAGGIAVITAIGAAVGGTMSGAVANAYYRSVAFKIHQIQNGDTPSVVLLNGFLTADKSRDAGDWNDLVARRYPSQRVYLVEWESKALRDLGAAAGSGAGSAAFKEALKAAARRAGKRTAAKIGPLAAVLAAMGAMSNPWHVTMV